MPNFRNLTVVILGFVIANVLLTIVGAFILDVPKFYSLVKNSRTTLGTIISTQPENQMAIQFEYVANGQKFVSVGRAEDIGKSFNDIQVGREVPVSYDYSNPSSATMGEPGRYLYSSLRGTLFIFVGLLICFVLFVLKRVI
jgi:hypothetical protein